MIIDLRERNDIFENVKLSRIYVQFQELLKELRKKELPQKITEYFNQDIEDLNSTSLEGNELRKFVKQKQTKILNLLEKELKIVPKDHFKNLWLSIGIPIGVIFGLTIFKNIAHFAIGIPIGMCLGFGIGSSIDKKALKDGRQLDLKIKF